MGSKNDDVQTPKWLYQALNERYSFNHDPCPFKWKGEVEGGAPNGLSSEWGTRSFVNPPFSQIKVWLKKGLEEYQKGKLVVFLISARVNSKYWSDLVFPNATGIQFLQGFFKFQDFERPLPVPIAVVEFDPGREPRTQPIGRKRKYEGNSGKEATARYVEI